VKRGDGLWYSHDVPAACGVTSAGVLERRVLQNRDTPIQQHAHLIIGIQQGLDSTYR
jgi:hypothetical protein